MTSKPPREGARWGDDPAPEPVVVPEPEGPPAEYIELCEKFGDANVKKALSIYEKIKGEYPSIPILEHGELYFADHALQSAKGTMEVAARDGRSHTMPETLKIIEKDLGGYLLQNPQFLGFATFTWNYGDEHLGTAGREREKAKEDKAAAWVTGISLSVGIIFFIANLSQGTGFLESLGIGAVVTVAAFLGLAYLYHNS